MNLERARTRLFVVVPLSLFLSFLLWFITFGSVRQTLLVFTSVPLAEVLLSVESSGPSLASGTWPTSRSVA